jgi:hypothetical protein
VAFLEDPQYELPQEGAVGVDGFEGDQWVDIDPEKSWFCGMGCCHDISGVLSED